MTSLYSMIYDTLSEIMSLNSATSTAAELVAICATLVITYYIVFTPLRLVLNFIKKKVFK